MGRSDFIPALKQEIKNDISNLLYIRLKALGLSGRALRNAYNCGMTGTVRDLENIVDLSSLLHESSN